MTAGGLWVVAAAAVVVSVFVGTRRTCGLGVDIVDGDGKIDDDSADLVYIIVLIETALK